MSKVDDSIEDEVPAVRSASTFDTSSTSIDTSSSSSRKTRQKLMRFEPSSCSLASEIILLRELKLVPVKLYPLAALSSNARPSLLVAHRVDRHPRGPQRDEGVVVLRPERVPEMPAKGLPAIAARNRSTRPFGRTRHTGFRAGDSTSGLPD
uniref:Uncharacterized protein n=1 Tax=Peronospora matthiolae TaxID=2874970 RepID=A0AAV1T7E8_9STRA